MLENDDFMSILNSLSSQTETESETQTAVNPQTQASTNYGVSYNDDYSAVPNYESQKSYNSSEQTEANFESAQEYQKFETPLIKRSAPAVSLTKKRQKLQLYGRMKIVVAVFAIIMAALIFVSAWNFAQANKIQSGFYDKQVEISALQTRINELAEEYTFLGSDEQIKQIAENAGFVDIDDSNLIQVELGDMHSEPEIEDLPSNWFNDVCEFLGNIFG